MATTVPMLSPDGTSGEIPADKVQAAMQAGFKQAVEMTSPDGKAGYIPVDRQQDAMRAGFKPASQAQTPWYQGTLSGNAPWQKAIDTAAQTEPVDTSTLGGFVRSVGNDLGAGAVRVFSPLVHPLNTVGGLAKTGGQIATGDTYDAAANVVRPFVKNPSGEAVAAIPQAIMAAAGAGEAPAAGRAIEDVAAGTGPKLRGAATALAGEEGSQGLSPIMEALKTKLGGPPEQMLTSAIKPGKNNLKWPSDIQTAIPQMKAAEADLGHPIQTIDDALDATALAKQKIWTQYKQFLGQTSQNGAVINGNQIADAMMDTIGPRMRQTDPQLVDQITARADAYRRIMPVDEAEQFLSGKDGVNNELTTYYAKNKVSQRVAEGDPNMAATVAEGQALRDALYSKIDDAAGPGAAQMKQTYGALTNVQKELNGRSIVYARQAPVNLPEQLSYLRAAGKIATGNVLGGVKDIAVQRFLGDINDTNSQIARAFRNSQPAEPFPGPTPQAPMTTNLLPAEAGGKIPLMAPDPGMSPGERTAALMQQLRQNPQLALPANVQPTQLPASVDAWQYMRGRRSQAY